jgi:hypothetical protein
MFSWLAAASETFSRIENSLPPFFMDGTCRRRRRRRRGFLTFHGRGTTTTKFTDCIGRQR